MSFSGSISLLLTPFLVLISCIYFVFMDFKTGLVKNKPLFFLFFTELMLQLIYLPYCRIGTSLFFFIAVFIVFSFLLYMMNIWGAGDGKLLSVIFLSYPLCIWNLIPCITFFWVPISAFTIGYIYCILQLIYTIVKKKIPISNIIESVRIHEMLMRFCFSGFMSLFSIFCLMAIRIENSILQILIIIFFDYLFRKYIINHIKIRLKLFALAIIFLSIILIEHILHISVIPLLISSFLMLVMNILNVNSTQQVSVQDLKKGMVLSTQSRLLLEAAKAIPPIDCYEKVSDKLDDDKIKKIQKWSHEKNLPDISLSIITTIPFVLFLFLGNLIYFSWVAYEIFYAV